MAEEPSPRRTLELSRELERRDIPASPDASAGRDFAETTARRPFRRGVGALTVIAALLAATLAVMRDREHASETNVIAVSVPLPAEPPVAVEPMLPAATAVVPPDEAREAAARDLARASNGDPSAQYEMALRFATGRGVDKDLTRAADWFREAAINGVAAAQYDLGRLYESGLGLGRDPIEAVIWYQSAADQNEPIAQLRLGTIYLVGDLVPRNPVEGVRWLRRAAEQGLAEAQAMLAARYETADGVARELASAYGWYALAAAGGMDEARIAKEKVAKSLAPEALSEAESRAVRLAVQFPQHATAAARQGDGGLLLAASPSDGSSSAVSRGMVGEIQRLLGASGYDCGPADGFLGEQTMQAIRRYQQDAGMPVDGTAGLALLNRLRAAAAGPPPAAQP